MSAITCEAVTCQSHVEQSYVKKAQHSHMENTQLVCGSNVCNVIFVCNILQALHVTHMTNNHELLAYGKITCYPLVHQPHMSFTW